MMRWVILLAVLLVGCSGEQERTGAVVPDDNVDRLSLVRKESYVRGAYYGCAAMTRNLALAHGLVVDYDSETVQTLCGLLAAEAAAAYDKSGGDPPTVPGL